uniref:Uncharacterized protein n=1 Tax=Schistocephalus solidus TaxID=70667 RepID=A0A0X3PDR2_SCHSO
MSYGVGAASVTSVALSLSTHLHFSDDKTISRRPKVGSGAVANKTKQPIYTCHIGDLVPAEFSGFAGGWFRSHPGGSAFEVPVRRSRGAWLCPPVTLQTHSTDHEYRSMPPVGNTSRHDFLARRDRFKRARFIIQ